MGKQKTPKKKFSTKFRTKGWVKFFSFKIRLLKLFNFINFNGFYKLLTALKTKQISLLRPYLSPTFLELSFSLWALDDTLSKNKWIKRRKVLADCFCKDFILSKSYPNFFDDLQKLGVEVVEDDRPLKPGFKFKDWELIGIPNIIVVGRRAGEGIVEYKNRQDNIKNEMSASEATNIVIELVKNIK